MKKLDNIDRKIIQILQKNARTPLKEIAAQVFLSSPSVSARIEKLEEEGVITGYSAKVNPIYLNYHIKAFMNVVECNCVTGDYSMLIETLFETTAELDHFINELQQFGRTKTQIVFSTSVEQRPVPIS